MHKNPTTGFYEDDFRRKRYLPDGEDFRLHVSYGVGKKDDALTLAAAVKRLVDGKHFDVIDLLREGVVTARQVADHIAEDRPIGQLRALATPPAALAPWPTVRAAADAMLVWIRENPNKSDGTYSAAHARYNHFCAFLNAHRDLVPDGEDTPLDAILTAVVEAYQRELMVTSTSINTVTSYVTQVGTLYRWQQRREDRAAREAMRPARVLHVPIDPETAAKGTSRRERYLTEPEAERLLEGCPEPLLFPVACGLFAGLRIDEMLHLRPAFDVDLALGLLIVQPQYVEGKPSWTPKTKKRREVPIAPDLRPILERHLDRYASEEWVVPALLDATRPMRQNTFTPHFARVVSDAELVYGRSATRGVVYHTLRHTFASWLIMRGVDLYTVAQLLGNSLKMVEKIYGHLAPDFRQRAVDRLAGAVRMPAGLVAVLPAGPATDIPTDATTTATTEADYAIL
jgi:integrase